VALGVGEVAVRVEVGELSVGIGNALNDGKVNVGVGKRNVVVRKLLGGGGKVNLGGGLKVDAPNRVELLLSNDVLLGVGVGELLIVDVSVGPGVGLTGANKVDTGVGDENELLKLVELMEGVKYDPLGGSKPVARRTT